jgi:hypothetical protein
LLNDASINCMLQYFANTELHSFILFGIVKQFN